MSTFGNEWWDSNPHDFFKYDFDNQLSSNWLSKLYFGRNTENRTQITPLSGVRTNRYTIFLFLVAIKLLIAGAKDLTDLSKKGSSFAIVAAETGVEPIHRINDGKLSKLLGYHYPTLPLMVLPVGLEPTNPSSL